MVESERCVDGNVSSQTRDYISSLPGDAERMLEAVRGHWGVENSVNWVLDVVFGKDGSRVRKGNSTEIFAALRRMALNMLKRENTLKVGIAAKRKKARWGHSVSAQGARSIRCDCPAISRPLTLANARIRCAYPDYQEVK